MVETLLQIDAWTWGAFTLAAIALMVTPGPGMMFCIACGLAGGPRAGMAAGVGAAVGIVVHTSVATIGLSAMLLALPGAYDAIRWAGAAYLLWLAWEAWTAGDDLEDRLGQRRIARAFRRALVTNLLNPKVIVFMMAFLPQFADPAIGPVWHQVLVFGLGVAFAGLVFDCAYGGLAGMLADRVRRASRFMNRLSAIVFGGLAARIALN